MTTTPKPGDRVRVTYEAEYVRAGVFPGAHIVQHTTGRDVLVPADATTIEVLAPPVETFKPGDVVRDLRDGRVYTIAERGDTPGYVSHQGPARGRWAESWCIVFTSEHYERVDLGTETGR